MEKGLSCLSLMQDKKGGYDAWGGENCESTAQVIVALCELGLPLDHPQFIKNGFTLLDNMLSFRNGEGYFNHTKTSGADGMATEQALYAMAAVVRAQQGKNSLDEHAKLKNLVSALYYYNQAAAEYFATGS